MKSVFDHSQIWMKKYSIDCLRISIGIVFLWFGLLKIFNVSPVVYIIQASYSFLPTNAFVMFLGVWEVIVGAGLLFKKALRATLSLLVLQMLGTFSSLLLAPALFFSHNNIFLLTTEGEFVIKNLVLISGALVIAAFQIEE